MNNWRKLFLCKLKNQFLNQLTTDGDNPTQRTFSFRTVTKRTRLRGEFLVCGFVTFRSETLSRVLLLCPASFPFYITSYIMRIPCFPGLTGKPPQPAVMEGGSARLVQVKQETGGCVTVFSFHLETLRFQERLTAVAMETQVGLIVDCGVEAVKVLTRNTRAPALRQMIFFLKTISLMCVCLF